MKAFITVYGAGDEEFHQDISPVMPSDDVDAVTITVVGVHFAPNPGIPEQSSRKSMMLDFRAHRAKTASRKETA